MGFRTKLDYSSNRQISQREKTDTILSGSTVFGLPFSGLTVGPDLNTSGVTIGYFSVISTFSGNSSTTNYNWFDPRMELAATYLSAITPTTSAITQETGYIYAGDTSITLDGNTSFLNYTGTFFTVVGNYIVDLGGGAYSGTVLHEQIEFLSASSVDYTGRTIWIDNPEITRTDRLIISRNPQVGYVWTCIDSEGMGEWTAVSGSSSGNTLSQVLVNGNSTGGENIDLTIGDKILFTPASGSTSGSASGETKLYVVDNLNENYIVKTETNYDDGFGTTNLLTYSVDNIGSITTEITQNGSSQDCYVYDSIAGTNGYYSYVRNQATNNGYAFYTQNEGNSDIHYGIKSTEYYGNSGLITKSRTLLLSAGTTENIWFSPGFTQGSICEYTLLLQGTRRGVGNNADIYTNTIKAVCGFDTTFNNPFFVGDTIEEKWTNIDITYSLYVSGIYIRLDITNNETYHCEFTVKSEERFINKLGL